jgi:hypothetical protein
MDFSTQSLNFPLIAANSLTGRVIETYTYTDKKCAKLERLWSARLIRRDPNATKLDMQRLQR